MQRAGLRRNVALVTAVREAVGPDIAIMVDCLWADPQPNSILSAIVESGAATVLQPDPSAAGGITEMRKSAALASTYGVPVVPHANESRRNAAHFLFTNPERTCPLGEWGCKINCNVQWFYRDCYEPTDGYYEPPAGPGFGYELDEGKIRSHIELP